MNTSKISKIFYQTFKNGSNQMMQLLNLPAEIKLLIAENLSPSDLNNTLKTNHHLHSLLTPVLHNLAFDDKDGLPALHWATAQGHEPLVRLLLESNRLDVHHGDPRQPGTTALHWAARRGREVITALLLENGVEVDPQDGLGHTPLFLAAVNRNTSVMKLLLRAGADVNARNDEYETMFHIAAGMGLGPVLNLLIDHGIDINIRTEGGTALHYAVRYEKGDIIRLLIDKGADLTAVDGNGETPADCAAAFSYDTILNFLLEKGPDISLPDRNGDTALHRAVRNRGHFRSAGMIKALIAMGAPLNHQNHAGETPLIIAAISGHNRAASLLLDSGADPTLRTTANKTALASASHLMAAHLVIHLLLKALLPIPLETWIQDAPAALLHAADLQDEPMVTLLLDAGIPIDTRHPKTQETPLHRASSDGLSSASEVTSLLLSRGATIDARDNDGNTPLHHASRHAREAAVKALLEAGADVKARNNTGVTALHWIAQNNNGGEQVARVAGMLLDKGADASAMNRSNQTPLGWAVGFGGDKDLVWMLRRAAAKARTRMLEVREGLGAGGAGVGR